MIDQQPDEKKSRQSTADGIVELKPRIVSIFPHDTTADTRGLAWYDGFLFESASSSLSSTIRRIGLPGGDFEEYPAVVDGVADGIAVVDGHLHLISSQHCRADAHGLPGLDHVRQRPISVDGHRGLAHDGSEFVLSTEKGELSFHSPEFDFTKTLPVQCSRAELSGFTEIEYGAGKIYGSVSSDENIYEICPNSGLVERIIDCSDLKRIAQLNGSDPGLNGIGYEASHGQLYVTGAAWRYVFALDITGLPVI